MKCFLALATIALILHVGAADAASEHPCAKEAGGKAEALLKYHFGDGWQKLSESTATSPASEASRRSRAGAVLTCFRCGVTFTKATIASG